MNQPKLHDVAKALSDELRVNILRELSNKPPMRHTDLRSYLGLDGFESNRLSYHLSILVNASLITKKKHVYTITERGREILEDLSVTIEEWEELAYREDLKQLSGMEAASLLWLDHQYYGSIAMVGASLLLFISTMNVLFLSIIPFIIAGLYLSYKHKPKVNFENQKKTIMHLKIMLGNNSLMPTLIMETGLGGVSLIFLIIFFHDVQQQVVGTFSIFFLSCLILAVGTSVWLTRKLIGVWDELKNGKKPIDYKDGLLIITNILIEMDIFIGLFILSGVITNQSDIGAIAGISGQLFFQAWKLFKETYVGQITQ